MSIAFRRGTPDDSFAVFEVFVQAIMDLGQRTGIEVISGGAGPADREQMWGRRRPLFEHLAHTAESFWLAENEGEVVGYGRAILRDGIRELTEFFVLPGQQSAGVGRELLAKVFPRDGAKQRVIIATQDIRALSRYLKTGVYARFPIVYFSRKAESVEVASDLTFEKVTASAETLASLRQIDQSILQHRRDEDHAWLLTERQGYLYRRGKQVVGYGYLGQNTGPFAVLDPSDFPAVLAHAESDAAGAERNFGAEMPLINETAVDYLLGRGYQMDSFIALFLSDEPFGQFDRYIFPSPPFFL
ncbi:MAG: GNAT family N-acetyltransferase [Ardenticatenaceae bacterium]|nr:GNAT family N-acetyltransferase [Ardenticatenaceae bacterium]MCB9444618.1 GNAT family N-acetyltransferase [Ardenticatenaceae bacterium]